MKKVLFIAALSVAGLVSAKNSEVKTSAEILSLKENVIENSKQLKIESLILKGPAKIEHGLAVMDTADGSCIVYGTYYTGDNGVSIFVVGSNATNASMGLPKCSGAGNYQA